MSVPHLLEERGGSLNSVLPQSNVAHLEIRSTTLTSLAGTKLLNFSVIY